VKAAITFPFKSRIAASPQNADEPYNQSIKHFHFGDNHGYSPLNTWIWNILQNRYHLPAQLNIPIKPISTINPFGQFSLAAMDLLLNPPILPRKEALNWKELRSPHFLKSGVYISRAPNKTTLVTNGNHNQEETSHTNRPGHNQNDVGSYIIYHKGQYLTGDPGGGDYSHAFGPDRYTRPLESSWGHPLPVVDNQLQRHGRTAASKTLKHEETPENFELVYDLTPTYHVEGLKTLTRTFKHNKITGEISIRDEYEATRPIPFETTIIQGITPKRNKPPRIRVETSNPYKVKETYMDGNSQFSGLRRIAIELERNQTGWIQYTVKPKEENPLATNEKKR
jgi:hypothetical protein